MQFRIADTFTKSLTALTNQEQKAVKITVLDLQLDPTGNGLRLHKLTGSRDKNFWSVSANMDLRIIIHRQGEDVLLCYVDHHDDAYAWAEGRKLEVHPKTGAAQLVDIAEVEREIVIPVYVNKQVERKIEKQQKRKDKPPLAGYDGAWLMQYGVPEQWVAKLQKAGAEELLGIIEHLPGEAAEAVLDIATGDIPPVPLQAEAAPADPFEHPDALRRFRSIDSPDELRAALDAPWDTWTIFLHPSQRELVKKDFSGPARVSGSAGTGKTVVALHRAAHLVRSNEDAIVLLTTFSDPLANLLRDSLRRLIQHEPQLGERIKVEALDAVASRLFRARSRDAELIGKEQADEHLLEAAELVDHQFSEGFLRNEWHSVVDPWQLRTWEAYENVRRIGRRTRLPKSKREQAWTIFEKVYERQDEEGQITQAGVFQYLADFYTEPGNRAPYDYVVVDEAQDISVPQLRFLAALVGERPNGLFFSGDLGQRIFQAPFSWSSLGVNVRGRASKLRINYRTSHQIRSQADLLLLEEVEDVDGNKETRTDTQSVFNGPAPAIKVYDDEQAEIEAVGDWITRLLEEGCTPGEIAIFVRSPAQLSRGHDAIAHAQQTACELDERLRTKSDCITLSTMHLAKGLEFKAVAVMACDEDVIPDPDRLEDIADMAEIEEVYDTERHLLYVACTRARDFLMITAAGEASEFIEDLLS